MFHYRGILGTFPGYSNMTLFCLLCRPRGFHRNYGHMAEKRQNLFLYVKFEISVNCPAESLISQICRSQFYLAGRWSQLTCRSFTLQATACRSQLAVLGQMQLAGRSYAGCPFRNSIVFSVSHHRLDLRESARLLERRTARFDFIV